MPCPSTRRTAAPKAWRSGYRIAKWYSPVVPAGGGGRAAPPPGLGPAWGGGPGRAAPRPGVEPDVVVVAARRQEHRLPTVASRHLETQDVAIERERALEVRNGEVDVPDMHAWVDGCHESYGGGPLVKADRRERC